MKVLGLDISSNTGWCILEDRKLLEYGLIEYSIKSKDFPWGILQAAEENSELILEKIKSLTIDKIVIERTNLGRARDSQAFLEATHAYLMSKIKKLDFHDRIQYIDSSEWRKKMNLRLTDTDKKHNKEIKKGIKILPVKGKISKKHLSVRMVNELYNLSFKLKHNDIADSILLANSYFQ